MQVLEPQEPKLQLLLPPALPPPLPPLSHKVEEVDEADEVDEAAPPQLEELDEVDEAVPPQLEEPEVDEAVPLQLDEVDEAVPPKLEEQDEVDEAVPPQLDKVDEVPLLLDIHRWLYGMMNTITRALSLALTLGKIPVTLQVTSNIGKPTRGWTARWRSTVGWLPVRDVHNTSLHHTTTLTQKVLI